MPAITLVARVKDLASNGPHVNSRRITAIGRGGMTQHLGKHVLLRQPLGHALPVFSAVTRAKDAQPLIADKALFRTDFRDYINRLRVMRVDRHRESKARR